MFFVIVLCRFLVIKYNSLRSIVSARVESTGAKVMNLGVQKKDESGGICSDENGARGGECE